MTSDPSVFEETETKSPVCFSQICIRWRACYETEALKCEMCLQVYNRKQKVNVSCHVFFFGVFSVFPNHPNMEFEEIVSGSSMHLLCSHST